ncbi:hypothetical protein L228DRAFT_281037 [Xylona heveae TC161]|uniref:Uncharacterized protein n=1 Tax=Xylona heveae (strain CBS 132557 / TC161) TaxID=1328760 RepID=A0A165J777_XYLHT|nr:hypothetical protein L228DRAFT_281037 [Xylona heveae TC161]KZF25833.1 hypothetical protein L228DRAFT_281037 [Xylona heveae TC161]
MFDGSTKQKGKETWEVEMINGMDSSKSLKNSEDVVMLARHYVYYEVDGSGKLDYTPIASPEKFLAKYLGGHGPQLKAAWLIPETTGKRLSSIPPIGRRGVFNWLQEKTNEDKNYSWGLIYLRVIKECSNLMRLRRAQITHTKGFYVAIKRQPNYRQNIKEDKDSSQAPELPPDPSTLPPDPYWTRAREISNADFGRPSYYEIPFYLSAPHSHPINVLNQRYDDPYQRPVIEEREVYSMGEIRRQPESTGPSMVERLGVKTPRQSYSTYPRNDILGSRDRDYYMPPRFSRSEKKDFSTYRVGGQQGSDDRRPLHSRERNVHYEDDYIRSPSDRVIFGEDIILQPRQRERDRVNVRSRSRERNPLGAFNTRSRSREHRSLEEKLSRPSSRRVVIRDREGSDESDGGYRTYSGEAGITRAHRSPNTVEFLPEEGFPYSKPPRSPPLSPRRIDPYVGLSDEQIARPVIRRATGASTAGNDVDGVAASDSEAEERPYSPSESEDETAINGTSHV